MKGYDPLYAPASNRPYVIIDRIITATAVIAAAAGLIGCFVAVWIIAKGA